MNSKIKGRILSALRKLTWSWEPRNIVKDRAKVDKALFQCEICTTLCYEGKSEVNFKKLQEQYPDRVVEKKKIHIDHLTPIMPLIKNWTFSWDHVIDNMFCEEDGLQAICEVCHDEKTREENEKRKALRKKA